MSAHRSSPSSLVLLALVLPALVLALVLGPSSATSEDEPQSGAQGGVDADGPPSIAYPPSRSSSTWIDRPDGTRVAVGKGVTWQGVTVYLSLLWDLVGVDAQTGKTLYAADVGAFWNALGFKQVTPRGGTKTWAVELRPGPRARQGKDRRQYHDLRTGAKLDVADAVKTPSGKLFEPRAVWHGKQSRVPKPLHVVVSSAPTWSKLVKHMFGESAPKDFGAIDFTKEVVLVVSSGNGWNCSGISVAEAYEDDARILLRTLRHSFQTMDGGEKVRPYGVFVLPRRAAKAYVVEYNRQGLIGGPALWTESFRLERLGEPEAALKALPPATDEPHAGWER